MERTYNEKMKLVAPLNALTKELEEVFDTLNKEYDEYNNDNDAGFFNRRYLLGKLSSITETLIKINKIRFSIYFDEKEGK